MTRTGPAQLLLGEWACLGLLCESSRHGFAIAALLKPDGEIGRVWSLSRPLTYRALDQLVERGLVRPVVEEPSDAGPNRTVLAATPAGRRMFRRWVASPVEHLRDVRSELLLKLLLAERSGIDVTAMVAAQRARVAEQVAALAARRDDDVVGLWRHESSSAALRFLDALRGP
jgi:DNA-binding PadR family transcriptional regulator